MGGAGMSSTVVRVRNYEGLLLPEMQELFVRAFKRDEDPDPAEVLTWCLSFIDEPRVAILVSHDDDLHFNGLAICTFPGDVWQPTPHCCHFFSEDRQVTGALLSEIRRWALGLGQERITMINRADVSDAGYARWLRKYGKMEKFGMVFTGTWSKEDSE